VPVPVPSGLLGGAQTMRKRMKIETEEVGLTTVLGIEGNLDTATAVEADTHIDGVLASGATRILLDFTQLDFISSAGLRTLLLAGKKLKKQGGELCLCSLNETVKDVFDISGFSALFMVYADRDEALSQA
jgi:anti-anti-sigma factor